MRKIVQNTMLLPILLASLCFHMEAQVVFKTIVPQQTVIVGESFPVQYVLEDLQKDDDFIPPVFKDFRLASGPYTYGGSVYGMNGPTRLKNIVFTLVAIKPGRFIINGATAKVNGKFIKSGNAIIDVITKKEAFERAAKEGPGETSSEYFLHPGEDPYEKMKKNLFMKVLVDKKSCYVGEPVVATFKLYSRLESRSDIVKNPGFYGFAVQDIITLGDNLTETEMINGKPFDVHTIRKVQLYPLQAGLFVIDPMEVTNKAEFSKSAVDKKTEQEITEGVPRDNKDKEKDNTVTYENSISTEKIAITVKPYPLKNKPPVFTGATGNFSINASLGKESLARNEEGSFIITIHGSGNFTQLSAPAIQWPEGIEGFEPVTEDSLDKIQAPLKGARTFRYSFISGKPGRYTIPSVSFSFFDPVGNNYKTISTSSAEVNISNTEIKKTTREQQTMIVKRHPPGQLWWIGAGLLLLLIVITGSLIRKRKQGVINDIKTDTPATAIPVDRLLQPAQFALQAEDGRFYSLLQKLIWEHLSDRLKLSGSKMNKHDLYLAMKEKKLGEDQ
ncbi:MAG: BatD family protein, partial [Bacteroidota bacterium]|nr:BatD family protein [Bacteroidota bacterium]